MSDPIDRSVIVTNWHRRELVDVHELAPAEREQVDVNDDDGLEGGDDLDLFFRFRGSVWRLSDFMRTFDGSVLKERGWEAIMPETVWTAVVIRLDDDRVIVGQVLPRQTA